MQAFEFEIDADKNIIKISSQYSQLYSQHLKVILLVAENSETKNNKYDFSDVAGKLLWQGDAVQAQRKIRDEW
jgi:hypothetical protein